MWCTLQSTPQCWRCAVTVQLGAVCYQSLPSRGGFTQAPRPHQAAITQRKFNLRRTTGTPYFFLFFYRCCHYGERSFFCNQKKNNNTHTRTLDADTRTRTHRDTETHNGNATQRRHAHTQPKSLKVVRMFVVGIV